MKTPEEILAEYEPVKENLDHIFCERCKVRPKYSIKAKYCWQCKKDIEKETTRLKNKRQKEMRRKKRLAKLTKDENSICPQCGTTFEKKVNNQIYCTADCRKRYWGQIKGTEKPKESIIDEKGKIDPYYLRRGKIHYGRKEQ